MTAWEWKKGQIKWGINKFIFKFILILIFGLVLVICAHPQEMIEANVALDDEVVLFYDIGVGHIFQNNKEMEDCLVIYNIMAYDEGFEIVNNFFEMNDQEKNIMKDIIWVSKNKQFNYFLIMDDIYYSSTKELHRRITFGDIYNKIFKTIILRKETK